MTSDMDDEMALRPLEASEAKEEDQRSRAVSGDPNRLTALENSEVKVMRSSRSCASLCEGHKSASKTRPPFLRTHTRLSIGRRRSDRGRSNSRVAIGKHRPLWKPFIPVPK